MSTANRNTQRTSNNDEYTRTTAPTAVRQAGPRIQPVAIHKKSLSSNKAVIFVVLALAVVAIAIWGLPEEKQNYSRQVDRHKVDAIVNKHLMMTNKKIELSQEKTRIEQLDSVPEVGMSILPRQRHGALYGIEANSDRNENNAIRDLERPKEIDVSSPDAIIQNEFADRQKQAIQESRARDEYARQFIANARAAGYVIELDDRFVVKSVRRLKPEEQSIFHRTPSASH